MAASNLVIVESPSKARTLAKFLGGDYDVRASMGHVVDLPKSKLGIDVDNDFAPQYGVIPGKEAQVRELRAAARRAGRTLLASDPDREGEAIAWHIANELHLRQPERIVFHEVTRPAVEAALARPRPIDQRLVDAQQARRVIDRLVGYKLSPLLWRKIRKGLSAGRVQSVAVRLVCDREDEIVGFVAVESWTVDAVLATGDGAELRAHFHGRRRGDAVAKEELADEASARLVESAVAGVPFRVDTIERRVSRRNPPAPFITSTLQQDASAQLRLSPKRTMRIAQELYEGVELGSEGPVGLITYMRTDSTRISDLAAAEARDFLRETFGPDYVGPGAAVRRSKSPVAAQEAHEAIRPTSVERTPDSVAAHLSPDQLRVYRLVWQRFVAGRMTAARFDTTRVDIGSGELVFRATGSRLTFDGFLRVLPRDPERDDAELPALQEGQALTLARTEAEQHFTQPPPRYSEATLIRELEERGIGRPSTYAPTIDTIEARGYVRQVERRLHPTPLGQAVNEALKSQFPDIVDVGFTAEMESRLDAIEGGGSAWVPVVRTWFGPFAENLERAEADMPRVRVAAVPVGEPCPRCGADLVVRSGRFGEFVGCSRFPECDYIQGKESRPAPTPTGATCPDCGKPLVERTGRRGPFVGCSAYPACRYIQPRAGGEGGAGPARPQPEPTGEPCPQCGKALVRRQGRFGPFVSCSGYPTCRYRPPRAPADAGPTAAGAGRPARGRAARATTRSPAAAGGQGGPAARTRGPRARPPAVPRAAAAGPDGDGAAPSAPRRTSGRRPAASE
ncbi:MAG TPA: type I DNA topoisomerase [Candidatus Micrarchaeia archaeon]|nr:type I DNA topoisomerase [Candidatus Micrarchaeia archaeon]